MNPVEKRVRTPSDTEVYLSAKETFSSKTDAEVIAELMRMIVFVAICYSDVVEDGQDPMIVFDRYIFAECDELAGYFPWPDN